MHGLHEKLHSWYQQKLGQPTTVQSKVSAMVIDSGATLHFIRMEENLPANGTLSKIIALPNGSIIKATHMVDLPFPSLADTAREAHVLPSLQQIHLLASQNFPMLVTQLCSIQKNAGSQFIDKILFTSNSGANRSFKGGETRMGCGDWVTNIVKVSGTYNQKAK